MKQPLPVTIIGGYLGAGKTTLVNQMLRQADGQKLAVLVNEFGELPIDEDLIEAQEDELISIAGGCICCAFGSDLSAAMLQLAELTPRPDHVVIESSGVAMPGAIASSIALLDGFRVDGVCVLADCLSIQSQLKDDYIGDTIARQITDADLILLSKTDLASEVEQDTVIASLRQNWPTTRIVPSAQGHVPNSVLLGQMQPNMARKSKTHPNLDVCSLVLTYDTPVDASALADFLTQAELGVIRAKGYVQDITGHTALVQIVGARSEVTFPAEVGTLGVVCIGQTDRLGIAHLMGWSGTAQ